MLRGFCGCVVGGLRTVGLIGRIVLCATCICGVVGSSADWDESPCIELSFAGGFFRLRSVAALALEVSGVWWRLHYIANATRNGIFQVMRASHSPSADRFPERASSAHRQSPRLKSHLNPPRSSFVTFGPEACFVAGGSVDSAARPHRPPLQRADRPRWIGSDSFSTSVFSTFAATFFAIFLSHGRVLPGADAVCC